MEMRASLPADRDCSLIENRTQITRMIIWTLISILSRIPGTKIPII